MDFKGRMPRTTSNCCDYLDIAVDTGDAVKELGKKKSSY